MIIANPIFDTFFKYMMQDKRCAKYFLETLLNTKITALDFEPQEFEYKSKNLQVVLVYRLDFKAVIQSENGEKTILIELQKASQSPDIIRFRNYLSDNYRQVEQDIDKHGTIKEKTLPIFPIYILGFKLRFPEARAVLINHEIKNLETGTHYQGRSVFIEQMFHDGIVIQIPVKNESIDTPVGLLLSIFDQERFIDKQRHVKEYTHKSENKEHLHLLKRLQKICKNPKIIKELEDEEEAIRVIKHASKDIETKLIETFQELEGKDKKLKEKDKKIEEKDKKLEEKDKKLDEKDKKLEEKEFAIEIFKLHKKGKTLKEISEIKQMNEAEVKRILEE